MTGLSNYDLISHAKKVAYVLKNPTNFIKGLKCPEDDAVVSMANALIFSFVNIIIFSVTKSIFSVFSNLGIISIVVNMIYFALFSCVALFVSGYVAHRIIIFLGGMGQFYDTIMVFCYSSAAFAFFGLPYVWLIPSIYSLVLLDLNLSLVHDTKKTIPLIAMFIPVILSIIAAAIIYVLTSMY